MTRVTLVPTTQYVGTLEPGWINGSISTPSPFGSVADGSDSTWTTLGSRGDTEDSSLLSVRFKPATPISAPAWFYMEIRAKNTAWHQANPGVPLSITALYMADTDTSLDNWIQTYNAVEDNSYQLAPLVGGHVSSPTTFNFYFLNDQDNVDTSDPAGSDTWKFLDVGSPMLDALNSTDGMRVSLWCTNTDALDSTWRDYLDVFELRLVLEYGPSVVPPCLLYPRTDDLGINGGVIYPPPDTQQYGLRTGSSSPL